MILGVDVWAGYDAVRPIDWDVAAGAGVSFAIAKCTEGNEPQSDDRSFQRNVAGAKAAGIPVGMYHYAFPLRSGEGKPKGRSPREQAERAFAVSAGLGGRAGELPPALDLEWPPPFEREVKGDATSPLVDMWKKWDVTAESIAKWGLEWLEHAERLWGRVPLIYTYPWFWSSLGAHGADPAFARYPLWIATYPASCEHAWLPPDGARPSVPVPWGGWDVWQFSADGSDVRVPGIHACPIDRNCMAEETLERLISVERVPTSEPERIVDWDIVHPPVPMGRHWEDDDDGHA